MCILDDSKVCGLVIGLVACSSLLGFLITLPIIIYHIYDYLKLNKEFKIKLKEYKYHLDK